mmetsp:Transcript_17225/g.43814  ORF Transcript_17225/g.43814 Transcript_17225/m.43814 type:complete len:362 (-) Transcript_17225:119-1204(-)
MGLVRDGGFVGGISLRIAPLALLLVLVFIVVHRCMGLPQLLLGLSVVGLRGGHRRHLRLQLRLRGRQIPLRPLQALLQRRGLRLRRLPRLLLLLRRRPRLFLVLRRLLPALLRPGCHSVAGGGELVLEGDKLLVVGGDLGLLRGQGGLELGSAGLFGGELVVDCGVGGLQVCGLGLGGCQLLFQVVLLRSCLLLLLGQLLLQPLLLGNVVVVLGLQVMLQAGELSCIRGVQLGQLIIQNLLPLGRVGLGAVQLALQVGGAGLHGGLLVFEGRELGVGLADGLGVCRNLVLQFGLGLLLLSLGLLGLLRRRLRRRGLRPQDGVLVGGKLGNLGRFELPGLGALELVLQGGNLTGIRLRQAPG